MSNEEQQWEYFDGRGTSYHDAHRVGKKGESEFWSGSRWHVTSHPAHDIREDCRPVATEYEAIHAEPEKKPEPEAKFTVGQYVAKDSRVRRLISREESGSVGRNDVIPPDALFLKDEAGRITWIDHGSWAIWQPKPGEKVWCGGVENRFAEYIGEGALIGTVDVRMKGATWQFSKDLLHPAAFAPEPEPAESSEPEQAARRWSGYDGTMTCESVSGDKFYYSAGRWTGPGPYNHYSKYPLSEPEALALIHDKGWPLPPCLDGDAICGTCKGSGKSAGSPNTFACPDCNGAGLVPVHEDVPVVEAKVNKSDIERERTEPATQGQQPGKDREMDSNKLNQRIGAAVLFGPRLALAALIGGLKGGTGVAAKAGQAVLWPFKMMAAGAFLFAGGKLAFDHWETVVNAIAATYAYIVG